MSHFQVYDPFVCLEILDPTSMFAKIQVRLANDSEAFPSESQTVSVLPVELLDSTMSPSLLLLQFLARNYVQDY